MHALLRHLERAGFDGAPRYLGDDEWGREVLDFIPGRAVVAPLEPWMFTDEALRSVAQSGASIVGSDRFGRVRRGSCTYSA